jgi:hypothetical protein
MTTLTLPAHQPFNFTSVVNSHGWVQLAPFRFDEARETLFDTDQLANGRIVLLCMRAAPVGVQVQVPGRLGGAESREVAEKVAWMFGLDQDFSSFYKAARVAKAKRRLAHGHVLRSPILRGRAQDYPTANTLRAATRR